MLNIFKLTGNNIRKFTSIQLANLFETSTKLMAAKKETITNGSAETATDTVDNMDGIVKFLELVGNLKVSSVYINLFNYFFLYEISSSAASQHTDP